MNTARSALSSVLRYQDKGIGEHYLVKRFLKGVFNTRPSLPRYSRIWDTSSVLAKLKTFRPANRLNLKMLTLKLVLLLALVTHQRVQTLHLIQLNDIAFLGAQVQITVKDLLKQSRPGKHLEPMLLQEFVDEKDLCVVRYLRQYLFRTKYIHRGNSNLFVSYKEPHKEVTKETISRWIRTILAMCGVNIKIFKSHSTRSASASIAAKFAPIETVLKAAGWANDCTFRRYYNKPLMKGQTVELLM